METEPVCLPNEIRPVPGWPGISVSATGDIYGPRGLRKPTPGTNGYLYVSVRVPGKVTPAKLRVHHAVLLAWVGPRPEGLEGRHLDGDLTRNEADALRWAKALETAAWYRSMDLKVMECEVAEFDTHWRQWKNDVTGKTLPRPGGWEDSIERFLALGITPEEMKRLVRVSMTRGVGEDVWRYFCGCCWRAVTELQESARLYLEADTNG